jgi:hypothetical protein
MKRKDVNYKFARELLYNKDRFLFNFIDDFLIKCNQMFHYDNLPDTVPKRILEKMLVENGYCIFTEENGKFYIFEGGLSGLPDQYNDPTECIVANPFLKLNKTYKINEDCILIQNDCRRKGLLPIVSKYAVMCGDCEISINMLTNILRSQYLISAGDNKTKESADAFIKKLVDGDFSVIAENSFLDGVKIHNIQGQSNYIQQFVELNQYLRATAFNEIGLDANYNMKRERLNSNEVMLNSSILIPLLDEMLESRQQGMKAVNEKYGLNISVELSSVWKMQKETVDFATKMENTETEIEKEAEAETEKETEAEAEAETEKETEAEAETEKETEAEAETDAETERGEKK